MYLKIFIYEFLRLINLLFFLMCLVLCGNCFLLGVLWGVLDWVMFWEDGFFMFSFWILLFVVVFIDINFFLIFFCFKLFNLCKIDRYDICSEDIFCFRVWIFCFNFIIFLLCFWRRFKMNCWILFGILFFIVFKL